MKFTRHKINSLIVFLISILGIQLFQNCTSSVRFFSQLNPTTQVSASRADNGTVFDGKPGVFFYTQPGFQCEGKNSAQSQIKFNLPAQYLLTTNFTSQCQGIQDNAVLIGSPDVSSYNPEVIGLNGFIFRKSEVPLDGNSPITETWCRPQISDPTGDIDVIISVDQTKSVTLAKVYSTGLQNSNLVNFTQPSFSVQRNQSPILVSYSSTDFSLTVDPKSPGPEGWNFKGNLQATLQGKAWSRPMYCRLNIPQPVFCSGSALTNAPYAGGQGTAADPFRICTPQQLNNIGLNTGDWNKNFKVMSDIDMSIYTGTQYNVIGQFQTGVKFTGNFDGNNYLISNLSYTNSSGAFVGLMGYVDSGARLENIFLSNVNFDANFGIGALAADLNGARINNCHVLSGSIITRGIAGGLTASISGTQILNSSVNLDISSSGAAALGGLVGRLWTNMNVISFSSSKGKVVKTSGGYVAGLVGELQLGRILNSFSNSNVSCTGTTQIAGGLVGLLYGSSSVQSSYASGAVICPNMSSVGGLVGYIQTNPGTNFGVFNSYATGDVSGISAVGGLVGSVSAFNPSIYHSYAAGAVIAGSVTYAGGLMGGDTYGVYTKSFWNLSANPTLSGNPSNPTHPEIIGATISELQDNNTFLNAGWDPTIWNLSNPGSTPKLIWQP